MESPKSLTAIVHVNFHYGELEAKPVGQNEIVMMGRILDQASELDPELQKILARFADYLNGLKTDAQSPS